ncbi:hypothetical protein [Dactylosporangium sp. NPDC000521]|uniref:hypothetical protein n=1 Tax=Dactylosporangium sp. NPDC000521 TaxID=3363975 RepID=UPI0036AD1E24
MTKRVSGAGVNRSAARRAAEVAALRQARLAAHEAAVTEQVAAFFDRSGRAGALREEARVKAQRVLDDADRAARDLEDAADAALDRLRRLDEPVAEIAAMTDQSVGTVRAALARAAGRSAPPGGAGAGAGADNRGEPPAPQRPGALTDAAPAVADG